MTTENTQNVDSVLGTIADEDTYCENDRQCTFVLTEIIEEEYYYRCSICGRMDIV